MSDAERHPSIHGDVRYSPRSAAALVNGRTMLTSSGRHPAGDWRVEALIDRLPQRLRPTLRSLRQPSRRWLRIPAGFLLILGGLLAVLPVLGLWMLPLGLVLLAEDVAVLRSLRSRLLDLIERRHPAWLQPDEQPRDQA
ncbi:MAG TPA: hypothetical protein VMM15_30125 [Bradyrhizobium sp.]|nr:hypothetical protein [Bradyrhizobium sp.]